MTLRQAVIACVALASSPAFAQSSVTLSGVVDGGLGYTSNQRVAESVGGRGAPVLYTGRSTYGFSSGTWQGDRWRLTGREDLGGGRQAIFVLENGFNIGTGNGGQSGRAFGRQAFTGLSDERLGSVTFGRQYDSVVDEIGTIGPTSYLTGMGAHPGDIDNVDNNSRVNNAVKYVSRSFRGVTFEGLYGFGGQPGSTHAQSTWSAGAQYKRGALAAGAAYLHANSDPSANGAWNGSYDGFFTSSITEGFSSARRLDVFAATATYTFASVTAGVNYSNSRLGSGGTSYFSGTAVFNTEQVTLSWQATRALRIAGGYSFTHRAAMAETGSAQYQQVNVSTFYSLSKRTFLYALAGFQQASGHTLDAFGNTVAATASLGDVSNGASSANDRQAVVRIGIRQAF